MTDRKLATLYRSVEILLEQNLEKVVKIVNNNKFSDEELIRIYDFIKKSHSDKRAVLICENMPDYIIIGNAKLDVTRD